MVTAPGNILKIRKILMENAEIMGNNYQKYRKLLRKIQKIRKIQYYFVENMKNGGKGLYYPGIGFWGVLTLFQPIFIAMQLTTTTRCR